jgi:SAM-dependent methyltransferase
MSRNPTDSIAESPGQVAHLARALYVTGPAIAKAMQHCRPYISPFELLLKAVPAGSRVLDIGCGGGLFLGLLAKTGRLGSGFGIDSSRPAIALANRMRTGLDNQGLVRFEARDAAAPLPEGQYDVVSLIDVMHHIPAASQRRVLNQAIDRVAPGGRFLYKDMVSRPFWRALANRMHDLVIARQWICYLPLERVTEWATVRGCVVIEKRTVNMLWYGHEMIVFQTPRGSCSDPENGALSSVDV